MPIEDTHPYQLALLCGADAGAAEGQAETISDVTPGRTDTGAPDPIAALTKAGLTASDMRSRVILVAGGDDQEALLATYAALTGFAGRFVDVMVDGAKLDVESIYRSTRTATDNGRPDPRPEVVVVGENGPEGALLYPPAHVNPAGQLPPETISAVRFSRRVRIVPRSSAVAGVALLAAVAGIRYRAGQDRFPQLCAGDEPIEETDGPAAGIDLEELRAAGQRQRRVGRTANLTRVAPITPSKRQARLIEAANRPIEELLGLFGCEERSSLWNCPRPENHTHGDATPSMKVATNKIRCHRCDAEPLDGVRLVMDMLHLTPDEAATKILGADAAWAQIADKIAAERTARANR